MRTSTPSAIQSSSAGSITVSIKYLLTSHRCLLILCVPSRRCSISQLILQDLFSFVHLRMSDPCDHHTLETLPNELVDRICSFVLGDELAICLNIKMRCYNEARMQQEHSKAVSGLQLLLRSNPLLKHHALKWLAHPMRRPYARTDNFLHFGARFGRLNARHIQKIDLKVSYKQKVEAELEWPALLKMLEKDMPALEHLKLYTRWSIFEPPYPSIDQDDSPSSLTREEQEMCAILRPSAFITLRHPTLRRIILPADTGRTYEEDENCVEKCVILDRGMYNQPGDLTRAWKSVSKWADETKTVKIQSEVSSRPHEW